MYKFNYHRADTINDAASQLGSGDDPQLLAGGMTLIPTMKQRLAAPSDLIDLGGVENLSEISVEGGFVSIGAMTPHAVVASSDDVRSVIPALARLAGGIGDPQVRNRGTIGGSIANSDPAADYPAAILGLGATIATNRREIAGDGFFLDIFETALEEAEIVTSVKFPIPDAAAYEKFPNPASRYAVVGVFVSRTGGNVRVGVTGAGPCAFHQTEMEAALAHDFAVEALERISVSADGLNDDMHASAAYRANLVKVGAKRAVARMTGA